MIDSIKVSARTIQGGCGIYEVEGDSYVKLFITDGGRVIPLRGIITEDDLMQAFQWGCREKWEPSSGESWNNSEPTMEEVLSSPSAPLSLESSNQK